MCLYVSWKFVSYKFHHELQSQFVKFSFFSISFIVFIFVNRIFERILKPNKTKSSFFNKSVHREIRPRIHKLFRTNGNQSIKIFRKILKVREVYIRKNSLFYIVLNLKQVDLAPGQNVLHFDFGTVQNPLKLEEWPFSHCFQYRTKTCNSNNFQNFRFRDGPKPQNWKILLFFLLYHYFAQ